MTMFMKKEEFIKEIEGLGFVLSYKGEDEMHADINIKKNKKFKDEIHVFDKYTKYWLMHAGIRVAYIETIFNEKTIEIIKILLKGLGNEIDDENNYNITFDVAGIIKEARFCGYKINEEQAKNLINYLYRKADGVYETIQQYITGYCQNNNFEELKEDEE